MTAMLLVEPVEKDAYVASKTNVPGPNPVVEISKSAKSATPLALVTVVVPPSDPVPDPAPVRAIAMSTAAYVPATMTSPFESSTLT